MKKLLALTLVTLLVLVGCMSEPEGPVGEPNAQEQQSAGAVATILTDVLTEDGDNLTSFQWNLFTDTYYSDGWWHTSFEFSLSSGDNGFLGIDANFQDEDGNDMMFPSGLTTKMRTIADFDGTFWSFPTKLDADVTLTRESGGSVLNITGSGSLSLDTMNLTFNIADLKLDLDVLYPEGKVTAKMVDEHLGTWDIVITFDGTNLVLLEMSNGTSTFQFTLDLKTGQIS